MKDVLPEFLQPFLWSYNLKELRLARDKKTIIKHILDYGDARAVTWLRTTYASDEIRSAIESSPVSDWSKKSLALWSLTYNAYPTRVGRFA